MERGQENEGAREKGEANNFEVSFFDLHTDIVNVRDFMERLKPEENQKGLDMDRVEKLKLELAYICTYLQLSYSDLEQFKDIMTAKRQEVENLLQSILDDVDNNVGRKYNMHHVISSLTNNMDDFISTHHRSKSSATMTDDQLNFLLLNLYHLSKYRAEHIYPLVIEYEILQNVCRNIRDFHGLIVNGCIEHKIVDYVLPQFQLMAERVGLFLWNDQTDEDSQLSEPDEDDQTDEDSQLSERDEDDQIDEDSQLSERDEDDQTDEDSQLSELVEDDQIDGDSRHFELAHLLMKIIPIELEVMHICFTNLKASTSAEVGRFINQLLETSPDILREFLIHLQEHMVNVITPRTSGARNIHVMMEFLLIILTDMPKDFIKHDKLFDLLSRVVALTRKVSTVVRDLAEKSRNKESTDETNRATLDFLENIELLKKDFKHVYLKAPPSSQCCFPMSDGLLFMHLLHRHLNDLLDSNAYSVALIKEEIGMVKEGLESVRSFVVNAEPDLYKDLRERVLDVAYEAKDVIDSIIVRDDGLLHLIFSLPIAIEKINLIKEEVSNLHEKIPKPRDLTVANSPNKPAESNSLTTDKIIVGFEEETDLIIRKLTGGSAALDVISIIGMPGAGKTTLAYKVYNDKSVSSHFDRRACCTVDQKYDEKKLLEKLFNQVTGSDLKISEISEDMDVADMLRKQLFGKRYLIVLDDLWDTTAWDALTRPFPDVQKGSRIILTTRQKEVALHAQCNSDPLDLRLLTPEESWELLEKRVFGKESCPDELLDVGKEIAQDCKGLPLVADLIAGVIAGKEKKKTVWLEVRNNLSSFIFKNEVEVMKVIELSYNHLADPLKSCFLYLGSWRKDSLIDEFELKALWRAEGLVEETEMKSVEEVMKVYLNNLISSSLVIFFNEIGEHSTFRLHDLVHDFCLIKTKEEKLFDRISSSAPSSSSYLTPRQLTIEYDKELFWLNNFVLFSSKKKRLSGKHLYSFALTGNELDDCLSDICHLRHLRLLRVLNLYPPFIKVNDSLLNEICMLVHLRYLGTPTEVKSLPASFSNLCNLETLFVENEGPPLVLLPTIWNLVKLRELCIRDSSFFDLDTDEPILIAEDSKLENLRLFWGLKLSYSKETDDIFKRFPNLQELEFFLKESWDCSTERYWFPKLDFLTELEELRVEFESSNSNNSGPTVARNPLWDFHFPSNLKKLKLIGFPLTSDSLSTIARLPNLEALYLYNTIFQGEEWNMGEEDTFEKLKCLKLKYVNLAKWEVGEESFPVLEKLYLQGCDKLEEIPSSFGDVYSLKIIQLVNSPQLEESALKIKQYAEDMTGEDKLQVLGWNNIPLFK